MAGLYAAAIPGARRVELDGVGHMAPMEAPDRINALVETESRYAAEARNRTRIMRDLLAAQEMMVGRYYLRHNNFLAAINRFRTVVTDYQTTEQVEEALMRLTEAYMALGIVNEAQTAAAVLGHNFPDSKWYQNAYSLLQKSGIQPQQHEDSWITQTYKGDGKPA